MMPSPLVLPLPPSSNHLYRPILAKGRDGHRHYSLTLTDTAKGWRDEAVLLTRSWVRAHHWQMTDDWVIVWFQLFWPDRRSRDIPNLKVLWDSLQFIIYPNDARVVPRPLIPRYDRKAPRVELLFFPLSDCPDEADRTLASVSELLPLP